MKNPKFLSLLNLLAWVLLIAFLANTLWSNKGCSAEKSMNDYNKIENIKKHLTQAGPYLFWHGDTLDVHTVDAGFMQYYEPKKYTFARQEALNTILNCATKGNDDKISFKLHPIIVQPSVYEMPEKMLIYNGYLSNFKGFKTALIGNGVINKDFNWTFGKGHLVLTNCPLSSMEEDFLPWLIYKLEQEADKAGGKIHLVLGQNPFERLERKEFDSTRYRPDFLKIKDWQNDTIFQKNSELGRWIYSKNVVENIGGYLIAESGLNENIIDGLPLDSINNIFREVHKAAKIDGYGQFYLDNALQKRLLKPQTYRDEYRFHDAIFGNISYQKNDSKYFKNADSDKRVDRVLNLYNATHIIGRFPTLKLEIGTANNNKYIGEINDRSKQGGGMSTNNIRYKGVLIEKNKAFIVDDEGKKTLLFKE